jgi:hypothetical protein
MQHHRASTAEMSLYAAGTEVNHFMDKLLLSAGVEASVWCSQEAAWGGGGGGLLLE